MDWSKLGKGLATVCPRAVAKNQRELENTFTQRLRETLSLKHQHQEEKGLQKSCVAEPKLFISAPHLPLISAPANAPTPAIICYLKLYHKIMSKWRFFLLPIILQTDCRK